MEKAINDPAGVLFLLLLGINYCSMLSNVGRFQAFHTARMAGLRRGAASRFLLGLVLLNLLPLGLGLIVVCWIDGAKLSLRVTSGILLLSYEPFVFVRIFAGVSQYLRNHLYKSDALFYTPAVGDAPGEWRNDHPLKDIWEPHSTARDHLLGAIPFLGLVALGGILVGPWG